MLRLALSDALLYAAQLVGDALPADLVAWKTVGYYSQALRRNVRELYSGSMGEREFVDRLFVLVDEQLTRAWNEGMRVNGLDPKSDMIDEWQEVLDEVKLKELDYVDDFAREIIQQAADDEATGVNHLVQYLSRADVWANRYTDMVNTATMTTAEGKDRLKWVFGDTDHCTTCEALNGIIAFNREWQEANVRPQSPPNHDLECGGWRCQCRLEPTDARRTRNALQKILAAMG